MDKLAEVKAGIFGVVLGDALGVPVEFSSRAERKADPVKDMREYGTHNQPRGTWSDDSSMMLASQESMIVCGKVDPDDMMKRFADWLSAGAYTPHGSVFDVGITCSRAIGAYCSGMDVRECGGKGERDNGNGSLMRIMPMSLHYGMREDFWKEELLQEAAEEVHAVSALTHAHPRSLIACMLYTAYCHELIYRGETTLREALQTAMDRCMAFYEKKASALGAAFERELAEDSYARLRDMVAFAALPEEQIKSSGYVVSTLEAAVWCLLNTDSYAECVLKAVNLGGDTDTTGAVAGGLVGLAYGYAALPEEWLAVIVRKEWIEKLCVDFAQL